MFLTLGITALTFVAILTVLVLIHELGHYTAARIIGVKVEEFGLGLPPRIAGKKIGETEYTINWLPIGGFVRLAGEDEDPGSVRIKNPKELKRRFWARSRKERAFILTAGVVMNFFLAVVITAGLLLYGVKEPSGRVHIVSVMADTPAAEAGILPDDIIAYVESTDTSGATVRTTINTAGELIAFTKEHAGESVALSLMRNGNPVEVSLTPREHVPAGQGAMGVSISDLERHKYPLTQVPWKAFTINVQRAWEMISSLGTTIGMLVTRKQTQVEIAGPIGIARITGEAIKLGWEVVLEIAGIISLNLAVLNILPIPALDGGRLAFVFLEKMLRRRINPAFEQHAHQIGMIVLFILIFLVSINDVMRLTSGG